MSVARSNCHIVNGNIVLLYKTIYIINVVGGDMKIIYAKPDDKRIGFFKMRYCIRNANCTHPAAALASLCHYNAFVCISCKGCFINVIKNMLWILCFVIYL